MHKPRRTVDWHVETFLVVVVVLAVVVEVVAVVGLLMLLLLLLIFSEMTRKTNRQSDEYWNRFQSNVWGETSKRLGGANMDFSDRLDI